MSGLLFVSFGSGPGSVISPKFKCVYGCCGKRCECYRAGERADLTTLCLKMSPLWWLIQKNYVDS